MKIKKIIETIEGLGWNVSQYNDGLEISQYSPASEDFIFYAHGKNADEIIKSIEEYAENFDTDEHIEMWVEAKYHGHEGIPTIRELVEDADEIKKMLETLADKVKGV